MKQHYARRRVVARWLDQNAGRITPRIVGVLFALYTSLEGLRLFWWLKSRNKNDNS